MHALVLLTAACAKDEPPPKQGCFWRASADEAAGGGSAEGICHVGLPDAERLRILVPATTPPLVSLPRLSLMLVPIASPAPFAIVAGPGAPTNLFIRLDRFNPAGVHEGEWLCGGEHRSGTFTVRVHEYDDSQLEPQARIVVDAQCPVARLDQGVIYGGKVTLHLELTARHEVPEE
jgi:hypothetical protein